MSMRNFIDTCVRDACKGDSVSKEELIQILQKIFEELDNRSNGNHMRTL